MEPFIGQIQAFGFSFAPRGWALCEGQLLPISQHSALFSLLGTTYGGDGRTTFGLPDLRGRASFQFGQGPGLSNHPIGQKGGAETVTLTAATMPTHTHVVTLKGTDAAASQSKPENNHLASGNIYAPAGGGLVSLAGDASTAAETGGNGAHQNMPPFLAINFCIALEGVFPSRN
jgi:microcystin-dependent protein